MNKKSQSTALVVAMSLLITAGCSAGKTETSVADTAATTGAATADANSMAKKLTINVLTRSYVGGGWSDKHSVIDAINEKFNVDFKVQWVPNDNYKEKINVMAASNDFPDLIQVAKEEFQKYMEKGVYLDVKPLLSKYPNLQKAFTSEDYSFLNPKDKYYGIPFYSIENRNGLGIRKDWLDKLGLKMPTTTDEFYNVAKAFATQDPDGNGKADTIGITFAIKSNAYFTHIDELMYAFGLANGWKEEGGKLIPWQTQSKELKGFLSFLQKAYAEGVLDKDFAINKLTDPMSKFESNKGGFLDTVPGDIDRTFFANLKKAVPTAEIAQVVPPKGPEGKQGSSTNAGAAKNVINNNIDKEKQDRILKILDYMVTDEGDRLIKNGVEGIDYKKNGDKYEKLPKFDENRSSLLAAWFFRKADPNISTTLWSDKAQLDRENAWYKVNEKYRNPNASAAFESPTDIKKGLGLDQKLMETMVKIILGAPVNTLDAAIEAWKSGGGNEIMAEFTAAYQKTK
jgi:putative aldouronate transport system substrate-binding protein